MRTYHPKFRERRGARRLAAVCAGLGALTCAGIASAQPLDTNPPLPDVMILLDTSGSMELMMDNCNPDTGLYPDGTGAGNCNGHAAVCDGHTTTPYNRWGAEVQALTGTFKNGAYACYSEPRTAGSAFSTEYALQYASGATAQPYDLNYFLNYHRPVEAIDATTACAYGFNQTAASGWYPDISAQHQENPASPTASDFSLAAIQGYIYNNATMLPTTSPPTPCPGGFQQNTDGLINIAQNAIRFGMMAFDSDPLPNTGVASVTDSPTTYNLTFNDTANTALTDTVTTGMWSYYNGWETAIPPQLGRRVGRPPGRLRRSRRPAHPLRGRRPQPGRAPLGGAHDALPGRRFDRAGGEQPADHASHPRDAPLRREPDRRHDGRREVLLLAGPAGAGAERPARHLSPAVHHSPLPRRAERGPRALLPGGERSDDRHVPVRLPRVHRRGARHRKLREGLGRRERAERLGERAPREDVRGRVLGVDQPRRVGDAQLQRHPPRDLPEPDHQPGALRRRDAERRRRRPRGELGLRGVLLAGAHRRLRRHGRPVLRRQPNGPQRRLPSDPRHHRRQRVDPRDAGAPPPADGLDEPVRRRLPLLVHPVPRRLVVRQRAAPALPVLGVGRNLGSPAAAGD